MKSFPSTVLTVPTRCLMYFSLGPTKPNSFSTCRHIPLVSNPHLTGKTILAENQTDLFQENLLRSNLALGTAEQV